MASDFRFNKKGLVILVSSISGLLILVFLLGFLIGLGIERPAEQSGRTDKVTVEKPQAEAVSEAENTDLEKVSLTKETKPKPVTPEFKEVSPKAEIPPISKPKTE